MCCQCPIPGNKNILKVKSKWTEIYGVSIQGIINFGKWLCCLNAMGDVRIMLLDP